MFGGKRLLLDEINCFIFFPGLGDKDLGEDCTSANDCADKPTQCTGWPTPQCSCEAGHFERGGRCYSSRIWSQTFFVCLVIARQLVIAVHKRIIEVDYYRPRRQTSGINCQDSHK